MTKCQIRASYSYSSESFSLQWVLSRLSLSRHLHLHTKAVRINMHENTEVITEGLFPRFDKNSQIMKTYLVFIQESFNLSEEFLESLWLFVEAEEFPEFSVEVLHLLEHSIECFKFLLGDFHELVDISVKEHWCELQHAWTTMRQNSINSCLFNSNRSLLE